MQLCLLPDHDSDAGLCLRYQAGDEGAWRTIEARYVRAVRGEARDNLPPGTDRDEAEQICRIALMKAARDFKPGKGTKFHSYAVIVMRRHLTTRRRAVLAQCRRGALYAETIDGLEQAGVPVDSSLAEVVASVLGGLRGEPSCQAAYDEFEDFMFGRMVEMFGNFVRTVAGRMADGQKEPQILTETGVPQPVFRKVVEALRSVA